MSRLAAGLLLLLAVVVALGALRMSTSSPESEGPTDEPPRARFAEDRDPKAAVPAAFDARRSMDYLEAVCKIGPRVSGSEGMQQQQELLKQHFEKHGGQVKLQRFTARQRSQPQPVEMANLIAAWHPDRKKRVILCAHYDTRPIADQEPDPRKWREPFVSANDGGSGVALLMELAHHVEELRTSVGIDFVFFDGEEYIFNRDGDKYFFGSEHFAQDYRKSRPKHRYAAAILLDMVGGKNAQFPVEPHSHMMAGALVKEVWDIASELRCAAFQPRLSQIPVQDDHLALNHAGIPAIDIIDFSYQHWHRLSDVPANCSGESLEQVARVLAVWLQRVQ